MTDDRNGFPRSRGEVVCTLEHRTSLGSYTLGALDPAEADHMRRHLVECARCRAEYRELAALPNILARITQTEMAAVPIPPGEEMLARLLERAAAHEDTATARLRPVPAEPPRPPAGPTRTQSRAGAAPARGRRPGGHRLSDVRGALHAVKRPRALRLVAAGAALAIATAIGTYVGTMGHSPAGDRTFTAADAASGISGKIEYHPAPWGSWVEATMHNVPPGDDCTLLAVDARGDRVVASTWWAPSSGTAVIPGGVAMESDEIVRFEVHVSTGQTVLTIPVH